MPSAENPQPDRASETAAPPPPTPPPPPPSHPPRTAQPQRPRRRWVFGLLLLLLVLTTVGLIYWWEHSRVYVSTDNVYVVGNITPIASDVAGQVVALFIDDNMIVQPGDPIAQIDPVPFQMKVDQALADFKQAAYDADAADITVNYTTDDRKSLLEGAQAKQAEAEQAVQAAEVAVRTHTRLDEKDEEVLASLKAQLPGLVALQRNAQDYYERFKSLAKTGDVPIQDF